MTTHLYEVQYKYEGAPDWIIMSEHNSMSEAKLSAEKTLRYAPHTSKWRIMKITAVSEVLYESKIL